MKAEPQRPLPTSRAHGRLARLLESRQTQGKLVGALDEFSEIEGLSRIATRRQLERLAPGVVQIPGRPTLFLTVPPEDRPRGAPPVAAWLHDYMRHRVPHYYLGLLSAAALHGASGQVPMTTQVVVPAPLRAFKLGRLQIDFVTKKNSFGTPLSVLPGLAAPMNVSTPAATLLDLVAFSARVGGMIRVFEVAEKLQRKITLQDLRAALKAGVPMPVIQRTGYLFDRSGASSFAHCVETFLNPSGAAVPLQTGAPVKRTRGENRWRVCENIRLP